MYERGAFEKAAVLPILGAAALRAAPFLGRIVPWMAHRAAPWLMKNVVNQLPALGAQTAAMMGMQYGANKLMSPGAAQGAMQGVEREMPMPGMTPYASDEHQQAYEAGVDRFVAELTDRVTAFSSGVDRFCKEAGYTEEQRVDLYEELIKCAEWPNDPTVPAAPAAPDAPALDTGGRGYRGGSSLGEFSGTLASSFSHPEGDTGVLSNLAGGFSRPGHTWAEDPITNTLRGVSGEGYWGQYAGTRTGPIATQTQRGSDVANQQSEQEFARQEHERSLADSAATARKNVLNAKTPAAQQQAREFLMNSTLAHASQGLDEVQLNQDMKQLEMFRKNLNPGRDTPAIRMRAAMAATRGMHGPEAMARRKELVATPAEKLFAGSKLYTKPAAPAGGAPASVPGGNTPVGVPGGMGLSPPMPSPGKLR